MWAEKPKNNNQAKQQQKFFKTEYPFMLAIGMGITEKIKLETKKGKKIILQL